MEIVPIELRINRFIGSTPATGVLAALDGGGVVQNLVAWDPVTGDVTHSAPVGTGANTRIHRYDRPLWVTNGAALNTYFMRSLTTTTGANALLIVNDGGFYQLGTENSTSTFWGTPPYEYTFSAPAGRGISLFVAGTGTLWRSSVAGGNVAYLPLTVTSTDQLTARLYIANAGPGGKTIALVSGDVNVSNSGVTLWNHTDGIKLALWTPGGLLTLPAGLTVASGTSAFQAMTATDVTVSIALRGPGNGAGFILARNAANTAHIDLLYMDASDIARIPRALILGAGLTATAANINGTTNAVLNLNGATGNAARVLFSINGSSMASWFVTTADTISMLNAAGSVVATFTAGALALTAGLNATTVTATARVIAPEIRTDTSSGSWSMVNSGGAGFFTANLSTFAITLQGALGVGVTPGYRFHVVHTVSDIVASLQNAHAASPYGMEIFFTAAAPNNASQYFIWSHDNSATRFLVYSNGGIHNYQANNVNLSDERLKTAIRPLGSWWDRWKRIEFVAFRYRDQSHADENIGVIAQQLRDVAPELVEEMNDKRRTLAVYTTDLYHAMGAVVQESQSRIERIEQRLASLN